MDWVMEARKQTLEAARNYLDERKQEIHDQGIRVRSVLRDVSPPQDILDVATEEQVDLIVMSSHGRGGELARWTFGSVADKILRHSPCPVLLIRPPSEE
jgi:nucleotide-binding universal stress UspA family protein